MSDERQPKEKAAKAGKKPYVKPDFQFEEVFETMALACGKTNRFGSMCRAVSKNS